MTRAAIYRRVSTKAQAGEDRFSLDEQEEKCTQWCSAHSYEVVGIFTDVYSGAELDERPEMTRLRKMLKQQKVDVVVATQLDRTSREPMHQWVILYELQLHDVQLEFTEETFEDTLGGSMMRTFAGFAAKIQRRNTRQQSIRGKTERARQGMIIPGSNPLYGYSWANERKTHYVVNPITAPIAIRIWNEAASGKSTRRIGIDLTNEGIDCPKDAWRREKNDPSDPPRGAPWAFNTIRTMLHNPAYWGEHSAFRWDTTGRRKETDPITGDITKKQAWKERTVGDGRYALPEGSPALISPELARVVHERLTRNKQESVRNNQYPEAGLLRAGFITCGVCKKNMYVARKYDGIFVYKCHSRNNSVSEHSCTNTSVLGVKSTDADVWERVMTLLQDPEEIQREMMPLADEDMRQDSIKALQRRVKQLDAEESNIARMSRIMGDQAGSEKLARELAAVAREKLNVGAELAQLEKDVHDQETVRERLKAVEVMVAGILQAGERFTYPQKRALLWMLNIHVTAYSLGHEPRYTVTIGRNGEMELIRLPRSDPLYCENSMSIFRLMIDPSTVPLLPLLHVTIAMCPPDPRPVYTKEAQRPTPCAYLPVVLPTQAEATYQFAC